MTRTIAIASAALVAISFEARLAEVREGPWCAVLNFGNDVAEDCQYRSLEECLPAVTTGFRGFCNHNHRWQPAEPQELRRKRGVRRQQ
jgi:hypothetical protein